MQDRRGAGSSGATPVLDVLTGLDDLRRALSSELSVAACAAEAGAFELARDVVDGNRRQLAGFSAALEALSRSGAVVAPAAVLPAAPTLPVATALPVALPAVRPPAAARRRPPAGTPPPDASGPR